MPTLLTCPQGHQWELSGEGQLQADAAQAICPRCNTAVALPASDSNRWSVTPSGSLILLPEVAPRSGADYAPAEPETLEVQPRPTGADPEATLPPSAEPAPITAEQLAVPGYEVISELGRGGMGVVYQARQTRLKRLVALKMILSGVHASNRELVRFNTEAEAVARLPHPHIVQIYEIGEHHGRPFFTFEYVDGGSLAQHFKGQLAPPQQAAELVHTLAQAIHYAHDQGIIHRDLKPANVLLASKKRKATDTPLPASLHPLLSDFTPKITDFGLAKQLDRDISNTQSGAVMGTANYMAPEQAWGRAKEVGATADVYSLGAILYELLTGRPPFLGETPMDTMLRVMGEEPVPPTRLRPGLPRDLETITLKCLNKTPTARYPTAQALADDLKRYLDGQPILARPLGRLTRSVRWAKRHPTLATVLGVFLFFGFLSLLGAATARHRQQEARRRHAEQLAPRAQEILHRYCFECHGQDPKAIDKFNVFDFNALLDEKRPLIIPGEADHSRLIQRIVDESMPPQEEEELPRLSLVELTILKDWIAGGAPRFPARELPPSPEPSGEAAALSHEVKELLREYCWSCHRFGKADGGIKILNHDLLVNKRKVVVPGQPDRSELYELMVTTDQQRLMPPPKIKQRPSAEEMATIRRWIAQGAPPFPRSKEPEDK